jgi:hypothetical protein
MTMRRASLAQGPKTLRPTHVLHCMSLKLCLALHATTLVCCSGAAVHGEAVLGLALYVRSLPLQTLF